MSSNDSVPSRVPPGSPPAPEPVHATPAPGPPESRSILIVDDNPEKTLALQSVIEELDHHVVVALSTDDALRELLKGNFALALIDVHLPGLDGFELARLIRSRPAHADLAIVFMSSLEQTDERIEDAYRLGAIDFVSLPARRPMIKAKLAAILGLRARRTADTPGEEKTRRSTRPDERLRLLLENTEDVALVFLDAAGVVTDWSRAAAHLTGWSADEMRGRSYGCLFVPGDVAGRVPEDKLNAATTGRSNVSEQWLLRKDGNRFWARVYVVALKGKRDISYALMLRDVSAVRLAEQELQIKAAVLEAINEAVIVVDESFRIVFNNPASDRIFGYEPGELMGSDVRLLNDYSAEENATRVGQLVAHLAEQPAWTGEWHHRRKDGTPFTTHAHVSVFERQGEKYYVCLQEDLTERKRAQAALLRSEQLQEVVGELEAFSYSVSHDLRTPLRTIRGYADAVIQEYGDALPAAGLHYLQRMRGASDRLEKLVSDILAFSRLPRSELVLAPIDPTSVIAALLEETPGFRPPQATIECAQPLPPVIANEPSLRQIFANLIGNAVKFVPKDRTPTVKIRADRYDDEVVLWIEDNGVGIRHDDHERIFRMFERASDSETYAGTGVGLAIVGRTVERLGGRVGVESEPGIGSRFWVRLRRG